MTLVDTNVLIDIVADEPVWADWSESRLDDANLQGPLYINDIVYAELSVRYDNLDSLDAFLLSARIEIAPIPKLALFLAGRVFIRYRKSGGTKTGVMPDFFIGAHAMVARLPLLTRDPRRYRTYFPDLQLITPDID